MSLQNAYHGETVVTLAIGDCGLYSAPYAALMPELRRFMICLMLVVELSIFRRGLFRYPKTDKPYEDRLAGIVIEPVLQGAGGMLFYHRLL